jgi:hypothetical protein
LSWLGSAMVGDRVDQHHGGYLGVNLGILRV